MTEIVMSKQYITTGRKILEHDTVVDDKAVLGETKPVQDVKIVSLEIDEADGRAHVADGRLHVADRRHDGIPVARRCQARRSLELTRTQFRPAGTASC